MAGPVLVVSIPCSFTSAPGPSFFPDLSPFFDFPVPPVGDARQLLTWGKEGFDFKGREPDLDKQPLDSVSGEKVGQPSGQEVFYIS